MAQAGLLKVKQTQKGAYEMQWKLKKTKRIILLNAYWFNYVEPDTNTFGFNCVQSVHHDLQALDTHFPFWNIHSVNKFLVRSIWLGTSTISNSVLRCLMVTIQLVWTFSSFKLGGTIWYSLDTWLKLLLSWASFSSITWRAVCMEITVFTSPIFCYVLSKNSKCFAKMLWYCITVTITLLDL